MIDEKKLIEALEKKAFEAEFFAGEHSSFLKVIGLGNVKRIIEHLPKVGEWIPCSERLPEPDKEVLVYTYDDFRVWSLTRKMRWEDEDGYWQDLEDVVAWMPLPDPYKEEC